MPRPLEDLRILAIEQFGAGPFGSLHLADLGAEVIKIEDPAGGGDTARGVPPFAEDGDALFFETFNRGKRSIALDLACAAGREVFTDLVRTADVVFSNLRGDVPAKLAITHADLAAHNPRIVCVNISGFGSTGPRAAEPGYDYVLQAMAGWMDLTGEPTGPPTKSGLSLVDYTGGLVAALSLLAAVHAAHRDGVGSDCDLGLLDVAVSMLTYPAGWYLAGAPEPTRLPSSAHPSIVPFQAFQAADGWLVIACPKDKFWQALCSVLDRPDLALDQRFATLSGRYTHRSVLLPELVRAVRRRRVQEWLGLLRAAGVPSGPVNTVGQALADPQVEARGLLVDYPHPRFGAVRQVATAARVGSERPTAARAPRLGEDTEALLSELGYDAERRDRLRAAGAFG